MLPDRSVTYVPGLYREPSNPRLLLTNARGPNRNRGASASLVLEGTRTPRSHS